ncbi:tetratricopeptide repeat protein [Solwaraspora sp. WMMD406]|uniref:tetratricopeptide repeat protein n=1 Tax=Solwaraspora sp. WMMD406 TaxID=3016095 RepID=UPI0024169207|nr:tetratricopeptide repeat protein [Solwaraspora sp. WMMD406]MDG4762944.1 tetratricopeptide repeat protein [Solwaraspora sp. WMMD406]
MTEPGGSRTASGDGSIAIGTNTGIANTGANPRFISLPPGALVSPEQVPAPVGLWNVPRRPSRVFVGRDQVMERVAAALAAGSSGVIGQSVAGLGGVGKTEVALHHAAASRSRYTGVWWVQADTRANLAAGLAGLARRLSPATWALTDEQAEAWATAWLHHHAGWLLVLDNVDDPADVAGLLGGVTSGHILVTTRRDIDWEDHGLTLIRIGVLDSADAVRMLFERTGQDDQAAAAGIAEYLGCLPLALEQAAAFIKLHRVPIADYRDRLRSRPDDLLASAAPGQDAQRAVTRVWAITLDAIRATDTIAIDVLRVLAWLGPDDIPRDLVTRLTGGDQNAADTALGVLASYSMITLGESVVSVHRLVQSVLRADPAPTDATTDPSVRAIRVLADAAPDDPQTDLDGWPRWRSLLPHVVALAEYLPASHTNGTLGRLLNLAAMFLLAQGRPTDAVPLEQRALAITEAAYGPDHPDVATWLNNLAVSYSALGRPADAVPLQVRALAITEAAYGPDHPDVATWLNNLAVSYRDLGRPADAVPLQVRALAITEAAYGPDHPHVATCLGNLAGSYRDLGRPADAVPLEQRALAITEAAYGPDHPDVATCLGNLAVSYSALGRPADAVPLQVRALAITEAAYGPDHPDVATRLGNLAGSYRDLGRPADAVPLQVRALAITEAAYGPDHPDVATCFCNLAGSYSALGRPADAVPLQVRALAITEAAYGPDHPDVATRLGNLAGSYRDLGRPADAVPLEQRASAITEAAYGPDHPDVATCLGNLAASYSALGRPADAVPLQVRALAITEAAYGPDHPHVATCLGNLAANYSALGRPADAVPLEQRASAITEAAYGPDHPTVAIRLNNLAANYRDLGRPADAVPLGQRALAITEAAYGPDHPTVAIRLNNLAANYSALGRPADAVPLEQRASAITEAAYGPDHPTVAIRLNNLAASYRDLGRPADAVPLQVRALAITEAAYGPDHPDVATCLGNLAASYSALGRPADAVPLEQRALAITGGNNLDDVASAMGHARPGTGLPCRRLGQGGAAGGCPAVTVVFRPGRVAVRGGLPPGGVPPARRAGRGVLIQYRTIRQLCQLACVRRLLLGPNLHKRPEIRLLAGLRRVLRK